MKKKLLLAGFVTCCFASAGIVYFNQQRNKDSQTMPKGFHKEISYRKSRFDFLAKKVRGVWAKIRYYAPWF